MRLLSALLLVVCPSMAFAVGGLGMPGPELNMLQRVQGQWQRHCYASVDGDVRVYRRDFLRVDYTHLHFLTKVYTDDDCSKLRTEYSGNTRFVLTGESRKHDGRVLFALNAELNPSLPAIFKFPELNVVATQYGKLFFGRDLSGESERGQRLTQLDIKHPFSRH